MNQHLVAPSILSADFSRLGEAIQMIEQHGADWIHIDVMDGHFVPNLSIGIPVVQSIRPLTKLPFDVHLMVENPEQFIGSFARAGADSLTVHVEVCSDLLSVIRQIHSEGLKAGVALNPDTAVAKLEDILPHLDLVLVMSVHPGFGGQRFIASSLDKVREMRGLMDRTGSGALLEVDGGVNRGNAPELVKAGAQVLVAGSSIFRAEDPGAALTLLKQAGANNLAK